MSNLTPTVRKLISVAAEERNHRAALAELAKKKRQLIYDAHKLDGITLQEIANYLGIKARQQVYAMYKTEKDKE